MNVIGEPVDEAGPLGEWHAPFQLVASRAENEYMVAEHLHMACSVKAHGTHPQRGPYLCGAGYRAGDFGHWHQGMQPAGNII